MTHTTTKEDQVENYSDTVTVKLCESIQNRGCYKVWCDETLVEGLCKVNGQQGGTIHQFFHNQDWLTMSDAYRDFRRMGLEFPSRASFEKLATQYHLTIDWT